MQCPLLPLGSAGPHHKEPVCSAKTSNQPGDAEPVIAAHRQGAAVLCCPPTTAHSDSYPLPLLSLLFKVGDALTLCRAHWHVWMLLQGRLGALARPLTSWGQTPVSSFCISFPDLEPADVLSMVRVKYLIQQAPSGGPLRVYPSGQTSIQPGAPTPRHRALGPCQLPGCCRL